MVRPCFFAGGKACAPLFTPHVSRAPFRRGGVFCRASLPVSGKSPLRPFIKLFLRQRSASRHVPAPLWAFQAMPARQSAAEAGACALMGLFPRCFCVVPSPAAFGHGEAVFSAGREGLRPFLPASRFPRPFPSGRGLRLCVILSGKRKIPPCDPFIKLFLRQRSASRHVPRLYGAVAALFLCCAVSGRFRAW